MLLLILGALFFGNRSLLQAQSDNRAGLVIVHGDGRVTTRCVTFTEPTISGLALLQRSGLSVDVSSGAAGATVCRIQGEGCPPSNCFCQCQGTPCIYWNYFYRAQGGPWTYAALGALGRTAQPGDVEGWVWGDGSTSPPALSFSEICASQAPVTQPTATPTSPETFASFAPTMTPEPPTTTPTPPSTATEVPVILSPTATVATSTATSTATPTATPAAPTSTPTATPTLPPTTATSTPVPTPEEVPESGPFPYSYVAYAVLILGLGAAFWIVKQRGT